MSATALLLLSSGALALAAITVAFGLTLRARGAPAGIAPEGPSASADGAEADRQRNLLLMRMSHDLRSPLNSVVTLSALLAEGNAGPLSIEQARYLEVIRHSAETLLALVNDILDLAAIEAGRLELETALVEIAPLLDDVGDKAAHAAHDKGIPLQVRVPERRLYVRTDGQHLRQVLERLVEHAIARTRNGYVELAASPIRDGRFVRLSVRENTPELAGADIQALGDGGRALDDYVAGEGPFANRGPAALPLVIAARLTHHLGLHISVEADEDEDSVSFELELPAVPEEGQRAEADAGGRPLPPVPPLMGPASGRVLLVEDDSLERRRVGIELEAAGYTVTLASSGDEGLALLRDGRYDVVVLDLVMPGMSGLDVLRAARADERLVGLPFVVLSALYMTKTERAVLGPNVAAVMRKGDLGGARLAEAIRRALAAPPAEARAPSPGHDGGPHA
jgi:signal transduction histidine kinase/CheY-like chemotaxis protein